MGACQPGGSSLSLVVMCAPPPSGPELSGCKRPARGCPGMAASPSSKRALSALERLQQLTLRKKPRNEGPSADGGPALGFVAEGAPAVNVDDLSSLPKLPETWQAEVARSKKCPSIAFAMAFTTASSHARLPELASLDCSCACAWLC